MAQNNDEEKSLSPDDAFSILGNETRMEILQTLSESDVPLTFSKLRENIGIQDSGRFNYHLDQLHDHFIRKTDEGYVLRQTGKRVVKTVLSGVVTIDPVLESVHPDQWACPYCDTPAVIGYNHERMWTSCPECPGTYGESVAPRTPLGPADYGFIGHARLPPAGIEGRSAREMLETALTWGHLDFLAMACGVCARCGARVESTVNVCERHDADDGRCVHCDCRHAVQLHTQCTNCIHEEVAPFALGRLAASTELLEFLITHGLNPLTPSHPSKFYRFLLDYDEKVLSVQPFKAQFTFTTDHDTLTLTVDDDLSIVEVTSNTTIGTG